MKKVFLLVALIALSAIAIMVYSYRKNATTNDIKVVLVTPEGSKETTVPAEGDVEDNFRKAFGMPSKEEESKAMKRLSKQDVLQLATKGCVYIKRWNAPAYYDTECQYWNGIAYDGGIFPVLQRFPDGLVKTVMKDREGEGFTVIFFRKEDITTNPRDTDWYLSTGNYDVEPEVPEVCGK